MRIRSTPVAVLLAAALTPALGACAPPPVDHGLPDGVEVSVHQNRPDTEDRRLQVRITNSTDADLTVNALQFSSSRFADPMPYPKAPTTIRAGGTLDLPVRLSAPVCDAAAGDPLVRVDFEFAGTEGTGTVVPDDRLDQLDGISERECLGSAIARIAELRLPEEIRVEPVGGRLVAMVEVAVVPSGASGSFTIHSVDDTVLFGLFDESSSVPAVSLPLEVTVRGTDEPSIFTIPLVPGRCDAHAVAEDKRGTLLPLRVEVGDVEGIHYLALADSEKGELYDYLGVACSGR